MNVNNLSYKVAMASLGCNKNQIDAEIMLAQLEQDGFLLTGDEQQADVIIVNTCGFIEEAKQEAIEHILELARLKQSAALKVLVVTGCLAERYWDQILEDIPEVDAVVGIGKNAEIAQIVRAAIAGKRSGFYADKQDLPLDGARVLLNEPFYAYLKIAEGCSNCCTYCAIPAIRGAYRSRPLESVVNEVKILAQRGVRELIVIAQDTTRYGEDLYHRPMLPQLLQEICKVEGIHWIRLLYAYPERITSELVDVMAQEDKILPYLDLPIQHCSDRILRAMNRHGGREAVDRAIKLVRQKIPDVTIRTTVMTGFPGETKDDFIQLCQFVKDQKFERLGCFAFSPEEDTPAADFAHQVEEKIKIRRQEMIMQEQTAVMDALQEHKIGTVQEVLVEGYDPYVKHYFGRTQADAPEIDCKIFFVSPHKITPGSFVNVQVTDTLEGDLIGEMMC